MNAPGRAASPMPRELVLASAGSGKTYRISSRLIALLAHGEPPDAVLASTFTRKAAGQILDRVLVRLARAARDPAAAAELAEHAALVDAPAGDPAADSPPDPTAVVEIPAAVVEVPAADPAAAPPADPAYWRDVLARLVRELHRVNVGTLDSFFMRAARSFSHELGLPSGWRIVDEATDRRLRSEALQAVLRADAGVAAELVRTVRRGDSVRSVHDAMLQDVDAVYRIHVELDGSTDAWDGVAPDSGSPPGESEREGAAAALEAFPAPLTGKGTPRRNWANALERCAAALRAEDWDGFLGNGLTSRILAGAPAYDGVPLGADVGLAFEPGLELCRRALGPRLTRQGRAMGRMAARFAEQLAALQRRAAAYRFEDVTRALGDAERFGDRPDLYYRLDMRTRHVLLDEFQDTSSAQWAALGPLVDELLSGHETERAALIVADPKQSIYGWRGAEPGLVYRLADRYGLAERHLTRSWRSSQVVLDAVDRVFEGIGEVDFFDEDDRAAARDWARAFRRHEAVKDLPGFVRLQAGPPSDGRSEHRPELLRHAAELARDLAAEAPGFGIGVLTRTNKAVARLIFELRRLGVACSEEGGSSLTDSAAVASVLALLRMADHPADTLARYHVARTPVGAMIGYLDPADAAAARETARRVRRRLLRDGYGETLHDWARRLAEACDAREQRRLRQLVELGFRYESGATTRPIDFVRAVELERVEDPSGAGVRVMTVHQAKGLEFDVVVLPELDPSLVKGGGRAPLTYREAPDRPIARAYPPAPEGVRRLFPELETAYRAWRDAALRDALSGLYVAMTRARHALHIVVKADGDRGPGDAKTAARIVRGALAPDRRAVEGEVLYQAGDPRWYRKAWADRTMELVADEGAEADAASAREVSAGETEAAAAEGAAPGPDIRAPVPAMAERRRMLPRRTPSDLEGGSRVDLRRVLRPNAGPALERGSIVHAWFQTIAWLDDGEPADDELRRVARRHTVALGPAETDALIGRFRRWLRAPAIRGVLSRAAYPANARVEREVPFVHRAGDAVVQGTIDRLVVTVESGRVAAADVLDFKTGALDPADPHALAERAAFYAPQLEAYRSAVGSLYRLPPDRVAAGLVFVEAGVVHRVQPTG